MDNGRKKILMLGILLICCGLTSLLTGKEERAALKALDSGIVKDADAGKRDFIKIYVSGAVAAPGIYELPRNSRAGDAIAAAGGLRQGADPEKINPAKKIKDGAQINIPMLKSKHNSGNGKKEKVASAAGTAVSASEKNALHYVNINTASSEELEALPGIGAATAGKIIAKRAEAPFRTVEDLKKVQGIGTAKMEKLRPYVTVR